MSGNLDREKWLVEGRATAKLEEFSVFKRKNILELDNGDGCTSENILKAPGSYTLKG